MRIDPFVRRLSTAILSVGVVALLGNGPCVPPNTSGSMGPIGGTMTPTPKIEKTCTYSALPDHPSDREYALAQEVQGVTHDEDHWYITNVGTLYKIPVGKNLSDETSVSAKLPMPAEWKQLGYNHMGALTYGGDGHLYIPLEGGKRPAIGVVLIADKDVLSVVGLGELPSEDLDSAWISYNPTNGLFYRSDFNATELKQYEISITNKSQVQVKLLDKIPFKDMAGNAIKIERIQGGDFSPDGDLYLVNDVEGGGLKKIDPTSGLVQKHIAVAFRPGCCKYEELEGVTYWDLDDGRAPNIKGQLHVLMLDNDAGENQDDLYFKHLSQSPSCR